MANYGAWHLADNPNLYEPMRNNTFEFIVTGLGDLIKPGASTTEDGVVIDGRDVLDGSWSQEVIRFAVNKVNIPNFTQSVITINRGNTQIKFAGPMTFGEGTLEVIDYIGADSKSVLMAWQKLSGDIKGEKVGYAANYKKNGYLIEYGPDFKEVRHWEIQGAWVSGVPNDELSNEGGNDKRVISATLQFDKAILMDPDLEV